MVRSLLVALALLASQGVAAAARADAWLEAVREEARHTPETGFERVAQIVDRSGQTIHRVDRYDPARPAAERWTLVSIDGRPPTAQEAAEHRRAQEAAPAPRVARLDPMLGGPHVREDRPDGSRVYRFAQLPPGTVTAHGFDLSPRLGAEATLVEVNGRPTLVRMQVKAPRPFRMMMVARMDRFLSDTCYARDAKGRLAIQEQTIEIANSVPVRGASVQRIEARFRPL